MPATLEDIVTEMLLTHAHRSARAALIDSDQAASMEKKKKEGYF
jgi:hypothetical protein